MWHASAAEKKAVFTASRARLARAVFGAAKSGQEARQSSQEDVEELCARQAYLCGVWVGVQMRGEMMGGIESERDPEEILAIAQKQRL